MEPKSKSEALRESSQIMQRAYEVAERYKSDAKRDADTIIADAEAKATEIVADAERRATAKVAETNTRLAERETRVFAAEASVQERAVAIIRDAEDIATDAHRAAQEALEHRDDILGRLKDFFVQEAANVDTALTETVVLPEYRGVQPEEFGKYVQSLLAGDTATPTSAPAHKSEDDELDAEDDVPSPFKNQAVFVDDEDDVR